jgi:hypothetical protein
MHGVVTNNVQKYISPIIISNWRWDQRAERHSDFISLAQAANFKSAQCWDTCHTLRKEKRRSEYAAAPASDADHHRAPAAVDKNGRMRLGMHRA